jgi:hypothetical protein
LERYHKSTKLNVNLPNRADSRFFGNHFHNGLEAENITFSRSGPILADGHPGRYVARRFKMVTELGKILDPFADK